MRTHLRHMLSRLRDWALPQSCLLCAAHSGADSLCPGCQHDLPPLPPMHCPVCAIPTPQGAVCGACLKAPPAFDHSTAAWLYRWPVDRLIPAFKYRKRLAVLRPLADPLLARVAAQAERPDALVPMPLHASRQQSRGFNQSYLLAQHLAAGLTLPVTNDLVARIKLTPPQASLPWDERRRAIKNAFTVTGDVTGLHLVIVDDVMTTGASLNELASMLKRAGARRVDCWTLARAVKQDA